MSRKASNCGFEKTPKRYRIAHSFSLPPDEEDLLRFVKGKVKTIVPKATSSEAIRLGILILAASPDEVVHQAAQRLLRVPRGRRPAQDPIHIDVDEGLANLPDEAVTRRRLILLDELNRLQKGPRGEPHVEDRIRTICTYFKMMPTSPESGGS